MVQVMSELLVEEGCGPSPQAPAPHQMWAERETTGEMYTGSLGQCLL